MDATIFVQTRQDFFGAGLFCVTQRVFLFNIESGRAFFRLLPKQTAIKTAANESVITFPVRKLALKYRVQTLCSADILPK